MESEKKHFLGNKSRITSNLLQWNNYEVPQDCYNTSPTFETRFNKRHFSKFNRSTVHEDCFVDRDTVTETTRKPSRKNLSVSSSIVLPLMNSTINETTYLDPLSHGKRSSQKSQSSALASNVMASTLAHSYIEETPHVPKKRFTYKPPANHEKIRASRWASRYNSHKTSSLTTDGLHMTTNELNPENKKTSTRSHNSIKFNSHLDSALHPTYDNSMLHCVSKCTGNPFHYLQESKKYHDSKPKSHMRCSHYKNEETFGFSLGSALDC